MNWFYREEDRYVEYGSSLDATRAFGTFSSAAEYLAWAKLSSSGL